MLFRISLEFLSDWPRPDTHIIEMPVCRFDDDLFYSISMLPDPPCDNMRHKIERNIIFDLRRPPRHHTPHFSSCAPIRLLGSEIHSAIYREYLGPGISTCISV